MTDIFEFPSAGGAKAPSSDSRPSSDSGMTSPQVGSPGSNPVGWLSPRISFSTSFASACEPDVPDFRLNSQGPDTEGSAIDDNCKSESSEELEEQGEFEFSVLHVPGTNAVSQGFMLPADELFFKGKLLPLQETSRTRMVEMLSSVENGQTAAATTKAHAQEVHYYASPSPFPFPLVSSPEPVRCPPQEMPHAFASSPPFPYPIACTTPQSCAQNSPSSSFVPLPSPRHRKAAKWKQVLRSLRKPRNEQDMVPEDKSDEASTSKVTCEAKRPQGIRMLLRRHEESHGHGKDVDGCAEFTHTAKPCSSPDAGSVSRAFSGTLASRDDGRRVETVPEPNGADRGSGHDGLGPARVRAAERDITARSLEVGRPIKYRDGGEERTAVKMTGGSCSPGRRSPGRGSPSRVYVKVAAEKLSPSRNRAVGRIVLKNLERVSNPAKRSMRNKDSSSIGCDKGGTYAASVRVMPVLNVPSVCIKPAFKSAKLSSRSRLGEFKSLFSKKEALSPAVSPLLGSEKTSEKTA